MDVLIGYTGFVGSNLLRQRSFDLHINSKNIGSLLGGSFDTVVCCGVSAVKWLANKDPQADRAGINALTDVLSTINAKRIIHISTIDVYSVPIGTTEDDLPKTEGLHPYGLHRLELEQKITGMFENVNILRLPALFGPGLRKNIIYDLMHDNMINKIDPAASFQWYPVTNLSKDIDRTIEKDLPLMHLMPEPIVTRDITQRYFSDKVTAPASSTPARYDVYTRNAEVFGATGNYIMSADAVLEEIGKFVQSETND